MTISKLKAAIEETLARRDEISKQTEWPNVTARLKAIDDVHDKLVSNYTRLARLAEQAGEYADASIALANLCSLLAASEPADAFDAARRFRSLPWQTTEQVRAHLEDALAIAHARRGDSIRSKQHRALALDLRRQAKAARGSGDGSGWLWADLVAGLRYFESRQAPPERYAITLDNNESLFEWLAAKEKISVDDVAPPIEQFVTNDRGFYGEALDRLEMLAGRVKLNLSKPDNYLLVADPGSGKSFFVRTAPERC